MKNVQEVFGNIDIYLFDQIQKGRFSPEMKILDAGCGGGRNIIYFLREQFQVFAVDQNHEAIEQVKSSARELAPHLPASNFQTASIERQLPFSASTFDWVISNAVLHFAEDIVQFNKMLSEMWKVLKPQGNLFVRLASSIGIEDKIIPTEKGRYHLPDGSERFLVDLELLIEKTESLGGELLEPIKTTNVQDLRCMTTWVLSKK